MNRNSWTKKETRSIEEVASHDYNAREIRRINSLIQQVERLSDSHGSSSSSMNYAYPLDINTDSRNNGSKQESQSKKVYQQNRTQQRMIGEYDGLSEGTAIRDKLSKMYDGMLWLMAFGFDKDGRISKSMLTIQCIETLMTSLYENRRPAYRSIEEPRPRPIQSSQESKSEISDNSSSKEEIQNKGTNEAPHQQKKRNKFSIIGFLKDYLFCFEKHDKQSKLRAARLQLAWSIIALALCLIPAIRRLFKKKA